MKRPAIAIIYTRRGVVERSRYRFVWAYSATCYGPWRAGAVYNAGWGYGWMTLRECQADAKAAGARALFVDGVEA